jgi:hypothetical protein
MKTSAVTARSVPMLLLLAANALFATCNAKPANATPCATGAGPVLEECYRCATHPICGWVLSLPGAQLRKSDRGFQPK